MRKFFKVLTLAGLLATSAQNAMAADIYPLIHGTGSFRQMVIEGTIEPGDFDRFIKIVKENQGQMSGVYLFSAGGDFDEGMKIGRAMRALELSSTVPMRDERTGRPVCNEEGEFSPKPKDPKNCIAASAAFFIHIGSIHRAGNFLAVHRPYYAPNSKFGSLPEAEAKQAFDALQDRARTYMQEMGVPAHVIEDVVGTSSDKAMVLDDKTVKTYFWTEIPSRYEWAKSRCYKMTPDEEARLDGYYQALLKKRDVQKPVDLDELTAKEKQQRDCHVKLIQESRLAAYEKYFGKKPSDALSHNFLKWSEAAKYLGRDYNDILSEEKFEESKMGDVSFLQRPATATAPMIMLSDEAPLKRRIVTTVALGGTPNPSPDYIQQLVKSLTGAWGVSTGGNGKDVWIWDKAGFKAKLTKMTPVEGPLWSLRIDANN